MNAVSADISFPSDKLHVLSVSETNSIVNFWVNEPTFSVGQNGGDIDLQGVVLSPGFTGSSGDVIDVVFQAVAEGSANLSFSSASVLANDGLGTNILTSSSGSSFTINAAPPTQRPVAAQPPTPSKSSVSPSANTASEITITSTPAIEDSNWYALNSIRFDWNMPSGADGVWYAFATDSSMAPSATSVANQTTSVSYDLSSLNDGVWYFLVSAKENGIWSPIATKILRLDRTPSQPFTITRVDTDPTDAQPASHGGSPPTPSPGSPITR